MRLLARREHGARELATKLEQRGYPGALIEAEIERLAAAGLQDDHRFAELFAEQRVERGDGPLKIRAALGQRGIDDALINSVLAPFEEEWLERARAVLDRRFGAAAVTTRADRARRLRFLESRGFPASVAWRALAAPDDD